MKRKDLNHLKIDAIAFQSDSNSFTGKTIDGIYIASKYTEEDIALLEDIDLAAGFAPYVRGIDTLMYVQKPWQIKQPLHEIVAENCNTFYHNQLAEHQKEITLALHTITQKGLDSSSLNAEQLTEHTGVILDTVEDMKVLLHQLPLSEIAVSIQTGEAILPILAFYIVAAQEQGIDTKTLNGNLYFDGLEINQNSSAFHASTSTKIHRDSLVYMRQYMPKFNVLSFSNNSLKQLNVTADQEVAFTLIQGIHYIKMGLEAQIPIDYLASHLSFSWTVGLNHFMEIAKMRAARLLWAKLIKPFNPKNEQSLALHIHAQTAIDTKVTTAAIDHLTPSTIEAATAVFGGVQSLQIQTSTSDMAFAIHHFLELETKSCKTIDPWAGSYYVEKLTLDIADKAWSLLEEMKELELAEINPVVTHILHKTKATTLAEEQTDTEKKPTPDAVNKIQLIKHQYSKRLEQIKSNRDTQKVQVALTQLTAGKATQEGNLLALAIEAARERATIAEIQKALAL